MPEFGFYLHVFFMLLSLVIIFTVTYIVLTNFHEFYHMHFYKQIVFLTSLAICVSSHEIVNYNFIKTFGYSPFYV
jgi:hypothetical protein